MNPDGENLAQLLDAYFEGTLDATLRQDLDQLLKSSAEAREEFWKRATLESALEGWAQKCRGESMALPLPARPMARWKRHLPLASGWAAAAALLAAWLVQSQREDLPLPPVGNASPQQASPAAGPAPETTPVAYLSRVSGVPAGDDMLQGRTLGAGREVTISGGLLELDFYSGARVSFQGPATFIPRSDMRLEVIKGVVQVDVPDSAKGFMLDLPDGTVTDFGTSFGVEVSGGKTARLQVISGEIELAGTRDGAPAKRLSEGQAVTLANSQGSTPIDFRPMAIQDSLDESSVSESERAIASWEALCAEMAKDPALLVHFRFLPAEIGSREIINRASGEHAPLTGTVIAAEWSRGRWPGKPALAFRNPADRVRVDVPGEYEQATFLAWVRVNGLPRRYNGLFLSEFGIPGEAHWQMSTDGRFWFGVRPKEERPDWSFHRAFSESVLTPEDFGTWHLLATSYDASRRGVIHYIDGAEVHRAEIGDTVPLRFGRATLGNFFDPTPTQHASASGLGEEWSFRNWSGAIDEFILYSRALEPEEIGRIHELGRPR